MNKIYNHSENLFEKLVSVATTILGNSISFLIALCLVLFWWINSLFIKNDAHLIIGDIIFGVTFLSLFIIQKSFNRFSASLNLKINELVSSHETASNAVLNAEIKTEKEITELSKEYSDLAEQIKELDDECKVEFNKELDKALDTEENHIREK
ncbi:low affinity Fe/Cu permease [Flavobacterium sp. 103]|uniref:low affinity iron permease family protein n=1 Tax=unclassified Flavobacterium TaxID=196869 RepID=UPI000D5ED960|nr:MULTISPECIES: low affinity iron permease family protein [unclassified Flavobacterium]PVX47870.1 low affinity Fe/Cu permease [Flavobacterium sp. 103]QKJ63634.1 low affinity iron permease family protein [Flavobacterium sp. M31R6]